MSEIKINVGGIELAMSKDEVSQAIEKGELKIENPDLKVFKKVDFDTFISNVKKETYEDAKIAGAEMSIKTAREKYGLTFEGKTIDNFAEAFRAKIIEDAKIEPSKKIQELEGDKGKLLSNYQELEAKHNAFVQSVETERKNNTIDNYLLKSLPDTGLALPKDEIKILLRAKNQYDLQEGKLVKMIDGKPAKNATTLNPLTLDEFLTEDIKPYIIAHRGGAGGGNSGGQQSANTVSDFIKEMESNGIMPGSTEFNSEMNKRYKAGQLK